MSARVLRNSLWNLTRFSDADSLRWPPPNETVDDAAAAAEIPRAAACAETQRKKWRRSVFAVVEQSVILCMIRGIYVIICTCAIGFSLTNFDTIYWIYTIYIHIDIIYT